MNYNITAYIIYLIISAFIIFWVGRICYQNGNVYINNLVKKETSLNLQINKMLLIGYYLLNIGYSSTTIILWNKIESFTELIEIISRRTAYIILIIAILHYLNIFLLKKFLSNYY